jgi:type I restriction enzyme S subunit
MANSRRYIPASQYCASVRDGTHDSPQPVESGRRLVTSRHLTSGRLDLSKAYLISDEDFEAINKRSKVDKWDVLISMIGTVGEPCLIREEPDFAIKNIGLFKSKSETDGRWLYYYLRSPEAQQRIREQSRGTTQQYIPLAALRDFPVLVTNDPHEQEAIAAVLGTLDDKIELNRRMNTTLEAMARALFQSWFVDFDPVRAKLDGRQPAGLDPATAALFPNEFEDSDLGPIPKGWEVGSILLQAKLLSGGTPKTDIAEYWNGDVLWASAKDVSQCGEAFLITTEKKITQLGVDNSATQMIPQFATVIVARGATTGRLAMFGEQIAMNQTCYALESKLGAPLTLYCQTRDFIDRMVHAAHGSVFNTITTRTFESISVFLPPADVLLAFNKQVAPLFRLLRANLYQSRTLALIRDSLLPKLLDGQLRIPT